MVHEAVYYYYTFVLFAGNKCMSHIIWNETSFACMGEVVLALLGRQREVGGERCWFFIDLSTLQRNSAGPAVCSLQLGQGLTRTRACRRSKPRPSRLI
jgi:hypothetical protein